MAEGRPAIAFYAPMKAPDHPTPSGDREIARLTLAALEMAGFAPRTVSDLRLLDKSGDAEVQAALTKVARAEADRLIAELAPDPPALWFTYHSHYKAPDLVGPAVSAALGLPYVISEPSISPRRRSGPWAGFAAASEAAIARADRLFWTTGRDRPELEAAGHGAKMTHLPAFLDPGPEPRHAPHDGAGRLLTIAMMRPGDKLESYRRLAAALQRLDSDWHLDIHGDGAARAKVEAAFAPLAPRVTFHGATHDPAILRAACEAADLFLWPGVGEGVGMVYLEAQAAGLPVIAEAHATQRELVAGPLVPPDDPDAFAAAIRAAAADRAAGAAAARAQVLAHHSIDAAAAILRDTLTELVA